MKEKLAIDGGPKAVTNSLVTWPQFNEDAIKAVEEVLRSGKVNYWTGRKGMEFEKKYAEWQGSQYAVSVATGTAALHAAYASLDLRPGDCFSANSARGSHAVGCRLDVVFVTPHRYYAPGRAVTSCILGVPNDQWQRAFVA